jgi:hypothetical protein
MQQDLAILHSAIAHFEQAAKLRLARWHHLAAQVAGRKGLSLLWTATEDAQVIALFTQGVSQLDIARTLPERTWTSIQQRYYLLVKPQHRVKLWRRQLIAPGETCTEFCTADGPGTATLSAFANVSS